MAHVTVPSENSYVRYTSQTGTGPFAFTFTVFEKDDLEVRIDGSALATSAWTIAWDTSDDGGYTGGSITLNSSLTASSTVDIVSVIQAVRGTDFSSGSISPTSLNTELDKLTAMTRDLQRDMARTVRFDLADTTADLGKLSDNASKVVAVNSSGTALEFATNSGTGGGGSGSGNVSNTGTPLNNQVAVWTNATTIEGNSGLTWDGSTLAVTGSITDDGVAVPTISSSDTLSNKTLASPVLTTPQINDTSSNQQYIFAPSELTADRTVTLPLLTGNDTFVFQAHSQTLTNKTIAFGSNTVSGTFAEFNTAVTDATLLSTSSTATLTNKTFDLGGTGNVLTGSTAEFNTALQSDSFAFLGATNTFTSANDFTGATVKVPASATPTIAAQGDFALDTSVTNYAPGALRYHDGTNDMHVVAVAASVLSATPTNGHVLTYDASNDLFYLAAAPGAGGGVSGTGTNDGIAVWSGTGSLDFTSGFTWNGTTMGVPGTITVNSGTGTDAVISEGGIDRSVAGAATFNIQNSGTGAMTLQVDGVAVLTASGTATLTNKTFDLGGTGNTLTGSKTEFNTALQSDTFVTGSDLGANVATFLATPSSANLAAAVTGESGTGALLFGTSPTIATPTLTLQDANGAAPTTDGQIKFDRTGETLEVGDGTGTKIFSHDTGTATFQNKTIDSANNTLTLDLSEGTLAGTKTEFNTALSADTFIMSSDLGTNVETFLGTPSSANLAAAVTGETGSGALVFGTSPTIATPTLTLKQSATPTPTAEGDIQWDSTNNRIVVGDGTGQQTFYAGTGITGTGANDQLAVWSGTATADGSSNLTFDGTTLAVGTGDITLDGDSVMTIGLGLGQYKIPFYNTTGVNSFDFSSYFTYSAANGLLAGTNNNDTATVANGLTVQHTTNGTAAAGFGTAIDVKAQNAAGTAHQIGAIEWAWTDATDTFEDSDVKLYGYTAGSKTEYMHLDGANQLVDLPTGWQFAVNGTPIGGGISASATPSDGQIGVWTSSSAMEGDAALTFDTTTDSLVIAASGNLKFGAVTVLADSAGTMTLSNVDALDATTEATIESAIDTLGNLTSATSLVSVGALTTGSIGSGFGTINIGTSNAVSCGTVELGHASDTTLARASAGNVSVEGTLLKKVGAETIWVPATAMTARTTSGAASGSAESTTNKVMIETFDFDAATDEFVQFSVAFPKSWNAGTVTAQFFWSNASGTGNVVWGCQAMSLANDDALDTAFGTAITVTDGVTAAGDLMVSAATSAITIAGTPGDDEMVTFQVYRDADNGSDTLAGDARLHGVKIIYTTDAANDD